MAKKNSLQAGVEECVGKNPGEQSLCQRKPVPHSGANHREGHGPRLIVVYCLQCFHQSPKRGRILSTLPRILDVYSLLTAVTPYVCLCLLSCVCNHDCLCVCICECGCCMCACVSSALLSATLTVCMCEYGCCMCACVSALLSATLTVCACDTISDVVPKDYIVITSSAH